jgi:hypothetical protein
LIQRVAQVDEELLRYSSREQVVPQLPALPPGTRKGEWDTRRVANLLADSSSKGVATNDRGDFVFKWVERGWWRRGAQITQVVEQAKLRGQRAIDRIAAKIAAP